MTLYRNTTWRRRLTVRNVAGALHPLTDTTLDVVISLHVSSAPLITLTAGSGITIADQGTLPGVADLEIEPAMLDSLADGNYVFAVGGTVAGERQYIVHPQRITVR